MYIDSHAHLEGKQFAIDREAVFARARDAGVMNIVAIGNGDGPPGSVGAIGRSDDSGRSWKTATMPGRANSTIWTFAVHPSAPQRVYAASVSGEVYRSEDGGLNWHKLPREFGEIRALAWAPE